MFSTNINPLLLIIWCVELFYLLGLVRIVAE